MKTSWKSRMAAFFRREWLPCLLVLILFALNFAALRSLGAGYTLYDGTSDDMSYVKSGITLVKTGMLTMHDPAVPSAQIMPGMSFLIAGLSLVFGEGKALWIVLKLLWCAMGALTGWFIYHAVRLYAPAWCAAAATLILARTDFLWCNNLILTETPSTLCVAALIYCTLQLGRTGEKRYFAGLGTAYFLGILIRGNMALNILFVVAYLLAVKYPPKRLLKQGLCLLLALLCFLVPWVIRNAVQFKAFLPLNFGTGNPILLGTYQGVGYPADEDLDYERYVDDVMPERYETYYNDDGTVPYRYQKYLALEADGLKASYRQRVWRQTDPAGFFASYLLLKPWEMMKGVFYWQLLWDIPHAALKAIQKGLLLLCAFGLLAALLRRRDRAVLAFLAGVFLGNILVYSMGFALDRYTIGLMPALCVFLGVGLGSLAAGLRKLGRRWKLQAP